MVTQRSCHLPCMISNLYLLPLHWFQSHLEAWPFSSPLMPVAVPTAKPLAPRLSQDRILSSELVRLVRLVSTVT